MLMHAVSNRVSSEHEAPHIEYIQFALLDDVTIRRYSVVEVNNITVYSRGRPAVGGINDLRMGTTDRTLLCGTCGNGLELCCGHIGHIEMPLPVYHGLYMDTVLKSLRCLCFWCSRIVRNVDGPEDGEYGIDHDHFAVVHGACRTAAHCVHCGGPQPQYVSSGTFDIDAVWDGEYEFSENDLALVRAEFTPLVARSILEVCSDEDWRRLGFVPDITRPESMVPRCIVVPPPIIRPAIVNDAKSRAQDDLTQMLQTINKRSLMLKAQLREHGAADEPDDRQLMDWERDMDEIRVFLDQDNDPAPGSLPADVVEIWQKLQQDVAALYNNTSRAKGQALQRSGAPTRTLKHRLCGKHGRLRENIMGKRTNMSARSVVSPDSTLDIDEIGIPECVATKLTVAEPVNRANLERLTRRVRVGANRIAGAACVITKDGALIDLEMCSDERRRKICLCPAVSGRPGDTVERYLTDEAGDTGTADIVIFNRQPSLHIMSMMCHKVRILPGKTFRLSELAAAPYNADFDGDEMNVHVPQSATSRCEAERLMRVSQLLITPKNNAPVIGLVQDSLLGVYLLTQPDVSLTQERVDDIMAHVRDPALYAVHPRPDGRYSGRDIVTALLPPIDLHRTVASGPDIVIRGGVHESGVLDKSVVGRSAGGVVQIIAQDYGSAAAARFLSDIQSVAMRYLRTRGFSMGIRDCILASDTAKHEVRAYVQSVVDTAKGILTDPDLTAEGMGSETEGTVLRIASGALSTVGDRVSRAMASDNSLMAMIRAGSKGNAVNYTQIMGCCGQNCVDGGRIGVSGGFTLPCFRRDDRSLGAHGFVESSYVQGLQPHEMFFHAMGGREGLIDTAVKTAVTGYLQRRSIKALEDKVVIHTPHDPDMARRPVVSGSGHVVQLHYGGDGCDAAKLERVRLPMLEDGKEEVMRWSPSTHRDILVVRHQLLGRRATATGVSVRPHAHLPVDVERVVRAAARRYPIGRTVPVGAYDPHRDAVRNLCTAVRAMLGGSGPGLCYLVLVWLAPEALLRLGVAPAGLNSICHLIRKRVADALIAPGSMVGIIAAQMIGEPLTQMTLNTFHLAGVGNQTQGISRVKELIDISRNPKTPVASVRLATVLDEDVHWRYANKLVYKSLHDVVERMYVAPLDGAALNLSVELAVAIYAPESRDRYAARGDLALYFTLGTKALAELGLGVADVAAAVQQSYEAPHPGMVVGYHGATLVCVPLLPDATIESPAAVLMTIGRVVQRSVQLQGYESVSSTAVRKLVDSTLGNGCAESYIIDAAGMRLAQAIALPFTDWRYAHTNDVVDVCETLGIEAARTVLLTELTNTICYDGTYVNRRHIHLFVDTMCVHGTLTPMNRHGINRTAPDETLKRCSYEETMEVISKAAVQGQGDNMAGVTPAVAMGQPCHLMGTASSEVMLDGRTIGCASGISGLRSKRSAPSADGDDLVCSSMTRYGCATRCASVPSDPGPTELVPAGGVAQPRRISAPVTIVVPSVEYAPFTGPLPSPRVA